MFKTLTKSWEQTVREIQRHKQEQKDKDKVGKYHCTGKFRLSHGLLCHSDHSKTDPFISEIVKVKMRTKINKAYSQASELHTGVN